MKVEKLAKNGEKGQIYHPLSPENNGDFRVSAQDVVYVMTKQQELWEPFP